MIKVEILGTRVEPGNAATGPDRVYVRTAHGEWMVPIPVDRGSARARAVPGYGGLEYAATLGSELHLATAQITEPEPGGPVVVVLDGRPEYEHDFEIQFDSIEPARALLTAMGFAAFTHVHPQVVWRSTGKASKQLLPKELTL